MPTETTIKDRVTFGFWLYLMSDCVLFATLFATYAVLHNQTFGAEGARELFNLPFVLAETMILLASSFTMGLAVLAVYARRKTFALAALMMTLILGMSFMALEAGEFTRFIHEGADPQASAFLSSFFALVGTHGAHVAFGALWIVVLITHIAKNGLTEGTLRKLLCLSLFWHFLDVIWIFIFTFVYLMGMLL